MDLRALRYFMGVVEAGSLSRAAHGLYVAQPALTAQIKKLEAHLGVQLLERSHHGITPTGAGTQLYEDARRLLSDADALRERLQRLPQGPEGSVTIALPFLLSSLLMGPVIAQLRQQHPRIQIFVLDDLSLRIEKALQERRADLGILVDTASLSPLHVSPLAQEGLYLCGYDQDGKAQKLLRRPDTHSSSQLTQLDFADAATLPLVLQSRRFAIRNSVEQAAQARQVKLNIQHEHDSTRVIRSLWQCGAGFTFTPACSLADITPWLRKRRDPRWVIARIFNPALERNYQLAIHPSRQHDRAVQVVQQALLTHAHALIANRQWRAQWQYRNDTQL